ncbi:glycoside hydrolase family 3 protein [Dentipellis sp. KUC8613]|nr:glycoside hydrolase family 3 protein [Dentipellis sp. KUC8613]
MKFLQVSTALLAGFGYVAAQQSGYGQCGGIGWTGATTCVSGWVCQEQNDYYWQCLPGSSSSSSSHSSSSTSHSSTSGAPSSTSSAPPGQTSVPPANISPEWKAAYAKAQTAVTKLSLQDKVNLGTGVQWQKGNCVGNTPAISSINFPGLCLEDSPLGVRYADFVSAFPPGINIAATFNRTLMRQRGEALGAEFRGKGVHVALGPDMNLMRAPAAGRNWEGFGGDPYLSGEGAFETVTGIQSAGVQACAKHYINNEQEHSRDSSSSNVDDRYQHELYLHPFLKSVQANVASVMCSYNQINGSFSCENDGTLNGLLKTELGFQGYVTSDWWATHSTSPAVNNGLDMTMPGDTATNSGVSYFGPALVSAVQSGAVPESRIDDMATRILAAWYLLGQDSGFPAVNFDAWNLNAPVNTHVNVQGDHASLIRTIGAASTVLLKNEGALPLKAPKTIGIVGNGAGPDSKGPNGYTDRGGDDGVLAMGWGSGTDDFPYLITPVDAITNRSKTDGTTVSSSLSDTDLTSAAKVATGKDVAFVFITADSGEGYITVEGNAGDRNDLNAWHSGDALVKQVASVNKNTIVVVNSVGPIVTEAWIDHPNVTALVWSGLPGQEAGNSLVDVLYGTYNPSGRLPYTIGKSVTDYSAQVLYVSNAGIVPINYTEGIFIDYRHFDAAGIEPRFEFGFGLSYTTFDYSGLTVTGSVGTGTPPSGPGSSLDPWLHDSVITVSFSLKNNGTVAGHESPQLYTSPPTSANAAPFNLKGFDNIFLEPGQSQVVSFNLSRYDLSFWNVANQRWEIPAGSTGVSVGASSRDLRLNGAIKN